MNPYRLPPPPTPMAVYRALAASPRRERAACELLAFVALLPAAVALAWLVAIAGGIVCALGYGAMRVWGGCGRPRREPALYRPMPRPSAVDVDHRFAR